MHRFRDFASADRASTHAAEQHPHRSRVRGVRMRRGQNQWPYVRKVQPHRQLPPDHPPILATAATGHNLHATDPVRVGSAKKREQLVVGALRRLPMQIQPPYRGELAGPEPLPGASVDAAGLVADLDRPGSFPG